MAETNLVPLKSLIIARKGKRVSPPIGKAFPFNADEVKVLKEGVDYRKAINEDEEATLAEIMPERNSIGTIQPKTNGQGGGTTTAMTGGADGAAVTGEGGSGSADTDARLNGTVPEIKGTVAEITDAADLTSLRAAEEAGHNRTGVLQAIDARMSALASSDDDL